MGAIRTASKQRTLPMTTPNRTISFFVAPALVLFLGCGSERTTGPGPTGAINSSFVPAGVAPAASQFYHQHNLVSDGAVPADLLDPNLVNAWGLVSGPTTPWWISDNGTGRSTLYNVGTGTIPLIVTVPGAGSNQSAPTGNVFNGGTGFVVNIGVGTSPARCIFASEAGTVSAFRGVPVVTVVPNAQAPAHGAIYKGLAIDSPTAGTLLYATDFHNGKVDIFDSSFHAVTIAGAF